MSKLRLEILSLGQLGVNCYLVMNLENSEAFIVDPGDEADKIFHKVDKLGCKPQAILLTHGHFDHIGAANEVRSTYKIPIYILEQEKTVLENPGINLTSAFGRGYTLNADEYVRDGEKLELAGFSIQVIHTPGHTLGSACFYLEEEGILLSGDTLFRCSVGRTDFPSGSMSQIHRSLHEKLFSLPDQTLVYPGHGEETDIHYEKCYNPY